MMSSSSRFFFSSFFVCVDVLTNRATGIDHHYQWLSSWSIHHNPQIGQYQNCNDYPPRCLGAENFLVGHEAAQEGQSPQPEEGVQQGRRKHKHVAHVPLVPRLSAASRTGLPVGHADDKPHGESHSRPNT